jgi:5'-nucleotidase
VACLKSAFISFAELLSLPQSGIDVKLVTSPHPCCLAQCTVEKYDWVAKHLGEAWFKRLIITMDKTSVQGDMLIDDKPAVKG